jgi:GntR family transcriptional regulator, transcriptional repressor for pyruvate dehydrogenase complex
VLEFTDVEGFGKVFFLATVEADTDRGDAMTDLNVQPEAVAAVPVRGKRVEEWRPVSRVRTYELVLDRIEAQIVSGALTAGERLPPERELAAMLGVSRPAVREALRILEAQGAIRSQVGKGPDSGTTIDRMPSDALARLMRLHVALGSFPLEDVVETRVVLERASVILACRNARPEDLASMRADLLAMDAPDIDRETFNQVDTNFHVALADAGGNRLMSDVTRAIRESVRMPILAGFSAMPETGAQGWRQVRDGLRADHHAIFEAVEAGQGEQAADRMEAHIRGFAIRLVR